MKNQKVKYLKLLGKLIIVLGLVGGLLFSWEESGTYVGLGNEEAFAVEFSEGSSDYVLDFRDLFSFVGAGVVSGAVILGIAEILEMMLIQTEDINNLIHSLQKLEEKKYLESRDKEKNVELEN